MAFGTVARAFDQIRPFMVGRLVHPCGDRTGLERLSVQKGQTPDADAAPDIEGELQLVLGHLVGFGRQGHHVGVEVADVFAGQTLIGRVGERGIEVLPIRQQTVRPDTLAQRTVELRQRPVADSLFLVRRNIRHVEHAELRIEHAPAAKDRFVVLSGRGVTGGTIRRKEDEASVCEVGALERGKIAVGMNGRPGPGRRQHEKSEAPQKGEAAPDPH